MRILVAVLSESGGQQGQDLGGDHHHQAVGQGHEFAAFADVGDAQVVVGPDDVVSADRVRR